MFALPHWIRAHLLLSLFTSKTQEGSSESCGTIADFLNSCIAYNRQNEQPWKINGYGKITLSIYRVGLCVFCVLHFLPLPSIYKPSFILIPFLLNKIWAGQETTMKTWLWGDNSVNIHDRIMILVHLLLFIYKPIYISIPLLLLKIWPDRHLLWKSKLLWGDNSLKIQRKIMVLVHCPSSHCHLSINQVPLQTLLYFSRYGPDRQH